MRLDNYRGWADEPSQNGVTGVPTLVLPTFDATTILGFDCSHHQGDIDFAKAKAAGARFVFIKATEGVDFVDPNFSQYRKGAKAAGIPSGPYHFFHPKDDLQSQIDFFCKTVGPRQPGDLPPVLDVENPEEWSGFTIPQRVAMVLGWLKGVEAKLGVRPIIYINNPMTNSILGNPAAFSAYVLWIAHYTSKSAPSVPLPWTRWTYWQYTENGTLDGVTGGVDLNRFNGTMLDLQNLLGVTGLADEEKKTLVGHVRSWFRWLRRLLGF